VDIDNRRQAPATDPCHHRPVALSADELAVLLESFESSEWTELVLSLDGMRLELTKPGAPQRAPAEQAEPAVAPHEVRSPSVGVFHPQAGAGDSVEADDVLASVRVLKLTLEVKARASGSVRSIHAADGDMVEHGQPLYTIES
jgi:acetyl-CoA carboxylase biotin carboxyl carrier protein